MECSSQECRCFRVPYSRNAGVRKVRLHELRDGDAYAEVAPVLFRSGFEYAGLIFNDPGCDHSSVAADLTERDIIVLPTRPPLDDDSDGVVVDRKRSRASGTALEQDIFDAVSPPFAVCKRSMTVLSEPFAHKLALASRTQIAFRQNRCAHYLHFRAKNGERWQRPPSHDVTAAFMIVARLRRYRAMLLNVFGMNGPTTLVWCHLLRVSGLLADALTAPRFVMVELTTTPRPPGACTLAYAQRWKMEVLLDTPL